MLRRKATQVVRRLRDGGHEAVFAGGCVRDRLLGITPKDYDIATSATPNEVEALFDRTLAVGRQFGIQIVDLEGEHFEVATFRKDGPYRDGIGPNRSNSHPRSKTPPVAISRSMPCSKIPSPMK